MSCTINKNSDFLSSNILTLRLMQLWLGLRSLVMFLDDPALMSRKIEEMTETVKINKEREKNNN